MNLKKKSVEYSTLFLMLAVCMFFCGCPRNSGTQINMNDPVKIAALQAQIKLDVSGAKSLGGGEGSNYQSSSSRSAFRSVSRSATGTEGIPPFVKFLEDGTGHTVYESLPPYNNLDTAAVGSIIPSPDGSIYIAWDIYNGTWPRFSDKPLRESYGYVTWDNGTITDIDTGEVITEDDIPTVFATGLVWRISKDGKLTWFSSGDDPTQPGYDFLWDISTYMGSNHAKNFQIDKNGNLYGYKFLDIDYDTFKEKVALVKYDPSAEILETLSECEGSFPFFEVCGDYIVEAGVESSDDGYFKVIPIANPSQSFLNSKAVYSIVQLYDSINDVVISDCRGSAETLYTQEDINNENGRYYSPFVFYAPFGEDNIVTWDLPDGYGDASLEGSFIRNGNVYALLNVGSSYKIHELSYSAENHRYTPSNNYIDVTSFYDKLDFSESKMNSTALFYLDGSNIKKVDASSGTVTDITPSGVAVTDFVANNTDVYITGSNGTSAVSGKINIASGEFTASDTTDSLTVMAAVDF